MGCDVCYTNHAEADQDDMDTLLTLLGVAGVNFIMGVPGADDIMLELPEHLLPRRAVPARVARPAARRRSSRPGWRAWASPATTAGCCRRRRGMRCWPTCRRAEPCRSRRTPGPNCAATPPARIALGRAGASLPTAPWLQFSLAHALARDAVHALPDVAALQAQLAAHDLPSTAVESAAADRTIYLRRPDLGRRLSARSAALLAATATGGAGGGVAVLVGDGLSAAAAQAHALPLLLELRPRLEAQGLALGRVVVATPGPGGLG